MTTIQSWKIVTKEYVQEEEEVTDDTGHEDGDDDDNDDDMDDQDWSAPCTFHYYDLILISCNLCFVLKHFWAIFHIFSIYFVLFQTFWL